MISLASLLLATVAFVGSHLAMRIRLCRSIGQERKNLSVVGESWRGWMQRTWFVPFHLVDKAGQAARLGACSCDSS